MGKISAALIIVFSVLWLAPMCAELPADLSAMTAPAAPVAAPEPEVTPTASEPVPAPPAPAPAPKAAPLPQRPVTVATYRSQKMFPVVDGKYVVSILRENRSSVDAKGVRLTLTSRVKGAAAERAESGPGQSLAAGTTSYFGLGVSTVVFETLIDGPDEPGTELEWSLVYRLEGDAAGAKRCYVLRALPRRREPAGITWVERGESSTCEDGK